MGRTVYYDHNGNLIDPPRADPIKPTNGDGIRAMTNEELAEWFDCKMPDKCPPGFNSKFMPYCTYDNGCRDCWLEWLEQEAE